MIGVFSDMIVTTDAIVLHTRRYGDTSRIVVLYTLEFGKVSVMARGARKPKSPFGASLEPLTHCRATIYHRRQRELHTVSASEQVALHTTLKSSYPHLTAGLSMCELVMRTQTDEVPGPDVFELLSKGLAELNESDENECFRVGLKMRVQLAQIMGFGLPEVKPPDSKVIKLDLDDGIPRGEPAVGIRMSKNVYDRLAEAVVKSPSSKTAIVSPADQLELEAFLSLYFSHHLDKRITSRVTDTLGIQ